MPSGIDAFRRKSAQKEQQRQSFESGANAFTNDFRLRSGQYAVARFLEQGDGIHFADVHRVSVQGKSRSYWRDYVCLDTNDDGTPCPACQHPNAELAKRRSLGFLNMIWREAPVFQRDESKRIVKDQAGNYIIAGREDQIAIWKCSWTVLEMLREKDAKFKGLMSRDWEIKRQGSSMNDTVWTVEPAEADAGPTPMLIPDLTLAETKYDVAMLTTALPFAELAQIVNRGAAPAGPQPTMDRSAVMGQQQQAQQAPTVADAFNQGQEPSVRASAFTRG